MRVKDLLKILMTLAALINWCAAAGEAFNGNRLLAIYLVLAAIFYLLVLFILLWIEHEEKVS